MVPVVVMEHEAFIIQSQAVEEEEGHSFTSQKIRIFYIMLVRLWLIVFICTMTCHIYRIFSNLIRTPI